MPRQRVQNSVLFYYNRHQKESEKISKVTKPVSKWKDKQGYETCFKVKRQARLRNLFQSEKTSKVTKLVAKWKGKQGYKTCFKVKRQARLRNHLQLAAETASHITPLSPWRGAGGEAGRGIGGKAGRGKAFYFITL